MQKITLFFTILATFFLFFFLEDVFAAYSLPGSYTPPVTNCPNNGSGSITNNYLECVRAGFGIDGKCYSSWKTPDGRSESGYTGYTSHVNQYSNGGYVITSLTFTGCGGVGIAKGWDCGTRSDMTCVSGTQCLKSGTAQSGAFCEPAGWCDSTTYNSCSSSQVCDVSTHTCVTAPTNVPTDTPTNTPIPSGSPSPTTTPTPPPTTGNLTLQIRGIGLNDNPNPRHPSRQIVLYFYPSTDTTFHDNPYIAKGSVTYNATTGYFSNASFPLKGLYAGKYLVLVRTLQGSLVAQIGTGDGTGPINIIHTGGSNYLVDTANQQDPDADTTVPALLMGDVITDCSSSSNCSFNYVELQDWNALVDCYGTKITSASCTIHGVFPNTQDSVTDMNDDGVVDGVDYTILMGNFGHYGIGQQTMNRGNPPQ